MDTRQTPAIQTLKPCPKCGSAGLTVQSVVVMRSDRPIDYSLSGQQLKLTAVNRIEMCCSSEDCDFKIYGHLEDAVLSDDGKAFQSGYSVEDR